MNNLTIVIPSYNNLEYLKLCYVAIRKSNTNVNLIIFDDGSTDGTYHWLSTLRDNYLTIKRFETRVGHTILYDHGFDMAQTEYIGIMHADMIVSDNFFEILSPLLNQNKIVSARCVEPPLHPEGAEKIVKNFGMDAKSFDYDAFCKFTKTIQPSTIPALFAPWFIHKIEYVNRIGKHDVQFAPYGYEDSDIFVRMIKVDLEPAQHANLLVYHFTQRGHKWNRGAVGNFNTDYQLQMQITQNRFLNKWGTLFWKNELHTPTNIPLYYRQLLIKNYTYGNNKYEFLNKFFNRVVTEDGVLFDDGRNLSPNYELIFDYKVEYNLDELQEFLMTIPFIIHEYDVGLYEFGQMQFNIFNKTELSIKL